MLRPISYLRNLGICLSIAILASCASTPPGIQEFAETDSPEVEMTNLENNLEKARADQVYVLSPKNFKRAEESLKDAREAREDNDSNKDVLREVAVGNAWLAQANAVASTASKTIPDIIDVRARALEARADIHAKKDLRDADEDLLDFAEDFEDSDFDISQKDRSELLQKYMDIELTAIKGAKLGPAKANIDQAKNEGAKKIAPQTFALAEKRYQDAEAFITSNRQNSSEIDKISNVALQESERVLRITRESKINKNKTPEELALEMEQERLSQEGLARELAGAQSQLGESTSALAVMAAESSSLSDQVTLDEKLQEAKEQFSEDEAEVLRDGNKLLIRLKGLNFPSGQADLTSASYPLMTKVQNTIRSLGDAEVEVEGHTDSIGTTEINARLSEERAESVKNYLVENGVVEEDKINSAGYADKRPISSNKTKEGRAQNRRVDVIITPNVSTN